VRPLPEKEREPGNDCPLGDVEEPKFPFEVTSMDITGPYPTTPRGNKYLITFIDHLTKYDEAFPIPDHTAETCARVYSSQIVTRHGSGSTLITCKGREFVILLPKNVQNIRRPQGAYFQLSCVLEWDGGKASPFPPFRPLALRKCKSKIGTKSCLSISCHTEQPLTQPRVTVHFTCCMGGKWFCPVPKI